MTGSIEFSERLEAERELFSKLSVEQLEVLAAESQALVDKAMMMVKANANANGLRSGAATRSARAVDVDRSRQGDGPLNRRRHAPDGVPFGPDGYVFGNTCGEHVVSIKKAWQTTVLKAHGHVPQWVKETRNHLAPNRKRPIAPSICTSMTCAASSAVACWRADRLGRGR